MMRHNSGRRLSGRLGHRSTVPVSLLPLRPYSLRGLLALIHLDITHPDHLTDTCDLGDSYVCTASGSSFFNSYFAGRYRQVHPGVSTLTDAYIILTYVDAATARGWAYVFAVASTGVYAFCPTGTGEEELTGEAALSPLSSAKDWYVVNYECAHPDFDTPVVAQITYLERLCLREEWYSAYQSYYWMYVLDEMS